MKPGENKINYPVQYCIQCNSTTEHIQAVTGEQKRCRRCGHVTGSSVIRDNLPLREGEDIIMEVDPLDDVDPVLG